MQGSRKRLREGVCLLMLAWQFAVAARADDNLLIYTERLNNGWQDWGWVPHYVTNNPSFNGTNSMVFAASQPWQAWYLEHDPIDTSLYTSVSLWLNGGPGGGQSAGIQAENGSLWGNRIYVTAPTNTWQEFTFSLASLGISDVTSFNGLQIWNAGTLQADFYLANLQLTAAPPPTTVHLGVNAAQTVRTVDARVFGVNTAAWDGDLDSPNTLMILSNTAAQILRWPGGSWGDIYFLTNEPQGWGSRTADLLQVATNLAAQVSFIVNYGSGTPQQAADWVRYCELTNHFYVKYWEVGNECYGGWEQDVNTNSPYQAHDPWTYAQRFTDYYHLMKAVDPTIKIGVVASPGEDDYANSTNHPVVNPVTGQTHNGWTPVMLSCLRSNGVTPDFLIEHNYAPADGDAFNLLWTSVWAANAVQLRTMLNDYLGSNTAANVELTATEFGPEGDKQWVSLVGGLFYADVVGQILQTEFNELLWWDLRNGPAVITNSDNALYGWRTNASGQFITDEGCVNGNAAPADCYPSFYCMELLRHFAGGGDTVVAATSDSKLLSAYAVRRTNGGLTLLAINKSSSASLPAAINLAGYTPSSSATLFSYGLPQDNAAKTGVGSPDIAETNFAGAGTNFTCMFPPYSASVLVFSPAPPTLALAAAGQQPGQIVLQLQGIAGVPYVIQMSSNLSSANWTAISTNVSWTGLINLTNPIAPAATYYRAIWQPQD